MTLLSSVIFTLSLHDALPIYYTLGIAKEHSYRSSLQTMLPKLVPGITAVNEPKRVACGAPDYVLLRSTANVPAHNQELHTPPARSEEHTSELQSLAYLVCRLL